MSSVQASSYAHEDATIFCGESTYDFIDDHSFTATDDESQDEMADSSISGRSHEPQQRATKAPDAVSRLADTASMSRTQMPKKSSSQRTGPSVHDDVDNVDDFDMAAVCEPVVFDESSLELKEPFGLSKVSRHLDRGANSLAISSQSTSTDLSVQQVIGKQYLTHSQGSYKVLFVGDHSNKDLILHKIARVLTATPSSHFSKKEGSCSSKYNIIPISNIGGNDSSEVVLIDSTGFEIEIEECVRAQSGRTFDDEEYIEISLSHGSTITSSTREAGFILSGAWTPPDLAVINTPRHSGSLIEQTCLLSWRFLNRHRVPILVIAPDHQSYQGPKFEPLSQILPHLCLKESLPGPMTSTSRTQLPINLGTFLALDTQQFNRTLACLNQVDGSSKNKLAALVGNVDTRCTRRTTSRPRPDKVSLKPAIFTQSPRQILSSQPMAVLLITILSSIVLVTMATIALNSLSKLVLQQNHPLGLDVANWKHCNNTQVLASSFEVIPHTRASGHPQSGVVVSPQNLSFRTDLASFMQDHHIQQQNRSENFKIHVLGDSYIVFMPPFWLAKSAKTPKLSFSLSRRGKDLRYDLVRMFDNIYALHIPLEEAHGLLQAKVWTSSSPVITQSLEINLGSSWLKFAIWRQLLSVSKQTAQNELQYRYRQLQLRVESQVLRVLASVQRRSGNFSPTVDLHTLGPATQYVRQIGEDAVHFACQATQRTLKAIVAAKAPLSKRPLKLWTIILQAGQSLQQEATARGTGWQTWQAIHRSNWARSISEFGHLGPGLIHEAQKISLKAWWTLCRLPEIKSDTSYMSRGED